MARFSEAYRGAAGGMRLCFCCGFFVWIFENLNFAFVSDFRIRVSGFSFRSSRYTRGYLSGVEGRRALDDLAAAAECFALARRCLWNGRRFDTMVSRSLNDCFLGESVSHLKLIGLIMKPY